MTSTGEDRLGMGLDKIELLNEIGAEVKACTRCRLSETRIQAVPGVGSPRAKLMFVGEGPGEKEDQQGEPFVGASGQVLTRELAAVGIFREDVFITNVVKCRPPQNRVPQADEIAACNDWLMAQIALIQPDYVVPVGNPSLWTLVDKDLRITKARLQVYRRDGVLFVPILHPSAAMRSTATMEMFREDIRHLAQVLELPIASIEAIEVGGHLAPTERKAPSDSVVVPPKPEPKSGVQPALPQPDDELPSRESVGPVGHPETAGAIHEDLHRATNLTLF